MLGLNNILWKLRAGFIFFILRCWLLFLGKYIISILFETKWFIADFFINMNNSNIEIQCNYMYITCIYNINFLHKILFLFFIFELKN